MPMISAMRLGARSTGGHGRLTDKTGSSAVTTGRGYDNGDDDEFIFAFMGWPAGLC
jgi:hypothetical protein